jgi:hypothetical protein
MVAGFGNLTAIISPVTLGAQSGTSTVNKTLHAWIMILTLKIF